MRFNPWRFTDEATLLRSFFDTVADGLKRSLTTGKERIGKVMREYGQLATVSVDYQEAKVSFGEGLQKLGAYWSTVSLDEKKLKVEDVLREEGRRVVVLIDDIDRLERTEIRQLFKLVKLAGDLEYMSYVLAFDPDMVAGALGGTYGAGAAKDGWNFLEKIVQVPLALPVADAGELQEYCFEHVNEALRMTQIQLPLEVRQEFEMEFDRHFASVLDTPRAAKRYANALAFIMPLLAGEVNPCDVMLLEGLKVFYPSVYAAIRESPETFTGSPRARSEGDREKAKLWMQEFISTNSASEGLIKKLFPLVGSVLRDGKFDSSDEVEWSRQQRVASREYLRRYLSCTVPRGDISDRKVDELVIQLEGMTEEQGSRCFLAFIADAHPRQLVWKLRVRVETINDKLARHLAIIIARSGDGIPGPTDKDPLFSPQTSAALVIRMLLARIEDPKARLSAARDVLTTATPLTFGHLCFQSMRPQRVNTEVFAAKDLGELDKHFADRIYEFAQGTSLSKAFPAGIYWTILLLHWQKNRGSEEIYIYYRRVLQSDPRESVALVRSQLGLAISGFMTNDFQLEHYRNLALLADPDDVYRAVEEVTVSEVTPEEAKLIGQFKALHHQQKEPVQPNAG